MKPAIFLFFIILVLINFSCNNRQSYPYAIRDFRKSLQPSLTKIVARGYAGDSADTVLLKDLKDQELRLLSECEHPLLRITALREMLSRESFNHFDVIMNHLSDTAFVQIEVYEKEIGKYMISDNLLENGSWKTKELRNRTVDEIIRKHNYLSFAYYALPYLAPQEKYYRYIKEMSSSTRPQHQVEHALYALAKFKKKEDVIFIKNALLKDPRFISDKGFALMMDFQNDAFMDVLEKYYPFSFYASMCIFDRGTRDAESFIKAVVSYKNERSAAILQKILDKKPMVNCPVDTSQLMEVLAHEIWENNCPAYNTLNSLLRSRINRFESNRRLNELSPMDFEKVDIDMPVEKEPIHWFIYTKEKDVIL